MPERPLAEMQRRAADEVARIVAEVEAVDVVRAHAEAQRRMAQVPVEDMPNPVEAIPVDEDDEFEAARIEFEREIAAIKNERGRKNKLFVTERSSASITFMYKLDGAVHVVIAGENGGQYFRKEDLAQFATYLIDEARKLAMLEKYELGGRF